METVLLLAANGYEDIELVAPLDVMTRVGIKTVIVGPDEGPIRGAWGTTMVQEAGININSVAVDSYSALIIPGGKPNATTLRELPAATNLVRSFHEKGKIVASICASPANVLGAGAGILAGFKATGDQTFADLLESSGAINTKQPVCVDRNIITATGPGTALLFALTIASQLGKKKEAETFAAKWGVELLY